MRFCKSLLLCIGFLACSSAYADTCSSTAGNLVSNCGFETGSFSSWSGSSTTDAFSGVDTLNAYQGSYEAYLGSNRSTAALNQTLATTAGLSYLIQFALANDTSPSTGYTNSFSVLFGGTSVFAEPAALASGYNLYSFVGTATSNSSLLSFVSRNDGGTFSLDNVSVTASAVTPTAVSPEPSSLLLLGTGVLTAVGAARRRMASRTA